MDEQTQGHPSDSLSEDDIASALGFSTTLSEPLLPQDQMDNGQDESQQTADQSLQTTADVNSSGAQAMTKDEEQDKEIQDIRAGLEKLRSQGDTTPTDGTQPEDTGTTG